MADPLLSLENLAISFPGETRSIAGLRNATLTLAPGETLALIGESGSGKSLLGSAVAGLLPPSARVGGTARFEGRDLLALNEDAWETLRGRAIAFTPQSAGLSLNPIRTALSQVAEVFQHVGGVRRAAAQRAALDLLAQFGLDGASARLHPHRLSGGMRQRVLVAIGLAAAPRLLVADEPTKGLDGQRRNEVIRVLTDVRAARPSLALLLITHDLILAERLADRVAVLYGGVLVEDRTTTAFFQAPRHPYARGLLDAGALRGLRPIPGAAPTPGMDLSGCVFAPRCDKMIPICRTVAPSTKEDPTGRVLCHSPEGGE